MYVVLFLYRNLDHFRRRFFLVLIASCLAGISGLAAPLLLTEFTKSGFDSQKFKQLIVLLVISVVISLLSAFFVRKYGESLVNQFTNHIRYKYFTQLENQPMTSLSKYHSGYILALVTNVADKMRPIVYDIFWQIPSLVVSVGFFFYFALQRSWLLAAFVLLILVFFVVTSVMMAKKMSYLSDALNQRNATFMQYYVDFLGNIFTIKRLGIRKFATNALNSKVRAVDQQIQKRYNYHAFRWLTLHSIYYLAILITIGFLLYEISSGNLAVAFLIIFIAIFTNMQSNIERLAENIIVFTETKLYIRQLQDLVAIKNNEIANGYTGSWNQIVLSSVSYQHPGTHHQITIPELKIEKSQKVCIFGKSGEGKTTILNLIANFLHPDEGKRNIDDHDYSQLAAQLFKDKVVYISQEVELFNLSVWDNLTLGQEIEEEKVINLLKALDMEKWFLSLKKGLQTIVGEKGLRLSAGQKQRLNLARGILLDREIYFLDEPTSSLDLETEKIVVAALKKYLKNKTVIIVTHRDAIKSLCDKFYEVKNHQLIPVAQ